MTSDSFIEVAVETWLRIAGIRLVQASKVVRSSDGQKGAIEIQLPEYTALVEVWEQERCLDTMLLVNGEQQVRVLSAGPCANEGALLSRLQALRSALAPPPSAA
jgi:hypothetical protein